MPWLDALRTPACPARPGRLTSAAGLLDELQAVRTLGMTLGLMRPLRPQRYRVAAPHDEAKPLRLLTPAYIPGITPFPRERQEMAFGPRS
jgi:hypothetical protein